MGEVSITTLVTSLIYRTFSRTLFSDQALTVLQTATPVSLVNTISNPSTVFFGWVYSEGGVCLGVTIWGIFNRSFCLYDSSKKFSPSSYVYYTTLGTRISFSCCCARVPLRAKETNLNTPTVKCIRAYIGTYYYYYFLILHIIITDAIAESTVVAAAL